jgi:hypothetical protein
MSHSEKFQTGFSKSHLRMEELIATLYSDIGILRKQMPRGDERKFRFKLEIQEI